VLIILAIPYIVTSETFVRVVASKFSTDTSAMVDSRIDYDINKYYEDHIYSSSMFFGIGTKGIAEKKIPERLSFKLFLIEYGWLSLFFLLLYYNSIITKRSLVSYMILFLFFLSFLQRPFLWTSWEILLFKMITDKLGRKPNVVNRPKLLGKKDGYIYKTI
jgi:hypothetical protein